MPTAAIATNKHKALAERESRLSSEIILPGSRRIIGIPAINDEQAPVAITSCEAVASGPIRAKGTTVSIKLSLYNRRNIGIKTVRLDYSFQSYSESQQRDDTISGNVSLDTHNVRPFERRDVTVKDSASDDALDEGDVDVMYCDIESIESMSGHVFRYPRPETMTGTDIKL